MWVYVGWNLSFDHFRLWPIQTLTSACDLSTSPHHSPKPHPYILCVVCTDGMTSKTLFSWHVCWPMFCQAHLSLHRFCTKLQCAVSESCCNPCWHLFMVTKGFSLYLLAKDGHNLEMQFCSVYLPSFSTVLAKECTSEMDSVFVNYSLKTLKYIKLEKPSLNRGGALSLSFQPFAGDSITFHS